MCCAPGVSLTCHNQNIFPTFVSVGEDDLFFDAREPDEAEVLPCNFPMPSSTSMEFLQIEDGEDDDDDDENCISPAQSFRTLGKIVFEELLNGILIDLTMLTEAV